MDKLRRRLMFALGALGPLALGSRSAFAQSESLPSCQASITLDHWTVSRTLGETYNLDVIATTTPEFDISIRLFFRGERPLRGVITIETKAPDAPEPMVLSWPPMPVSAQIEGVPIQVKNISVKSTDNGSTATYDIAPEYAKPLLERMLGGGQLRIAGLVYDRAAQGYSRQVSSSIDLAPLRNYPARIGAMDEVLREELSKELCKVQKASCFLTTTCCVAIGLPDDCFELTQMRSFRDNWLVHQPGGPEAIDTYRREAPRIAAAIVASHERDRICRLLYFGYILPALAMSGLGLRRAAWRHYLRMISRATAMVAATASEARAREEG